MTPEQFRMAKAALGLSNPDLADMTGLHRNTLNKLDAGLGKASTAQLVRLTLEGRGVQFLDAGMAASGAGVAMVAAAGEVKAAAADESSIAPARGHPPA